jgi:hypothetical protein
MWTIVYRGAECGEATALGGPHRSAQKQKKALQKRRCHGEITSSGEPFRRHLWKRVRKSSRGAYVPCLEATMRRTRVREPSPPISF